MRTVLKTPIASAMVAAALILPLAAWAQTTKPPAAPAKMGEATATASQTNTRKDRVEQRIKDMYATLKITPAQEQQWDQFATVMLSNAQAMDEVLTQNAGKEATQSAQDILQGYAQITQIHAQNVQKLSAAFDTLYAALTPEQKATADQMFRTTAARREQKMEQKKQNG